MKQLLGGKGANLAEMTCLGLPVPDGFTITTQACKEFYDLGKKYPKGLGEQVNEAVKKLEEKIGKKLGDEKDPLLVSVRSGAAASMPGMMDTVLNLGLNDKTVEGLARKTGNARFAYDAYRRFIQMFGNVVMEVEHSKFEEVLESVKDTKGVEFDTELGEQDLRKLVKDYEKLIHKEKGINFPQDPMEQLQMSIDAVFGSWNNARAVSYRRLNDIRGLLGTAVNIQAMVFGNMGESSGTGVAFTRNPSTGEKKIYGEFLMNAQGEDVVAGIRTPRPILELKKIMPKAYDEFIKIAEKLENHYKDMQDMEFTIQESKLYFLQTRNGKRTAFSAVKIAVDMVEEGLITKEQALLRVDANSLNQLLHPRLDELAKKEAELIAKGLPASPGAAVGGVVFTAEQAYEEAEKGKPVILVRLETSPEDIEGMNAAKGILTARGGMTCVSGDSMILTNKGFLTSEKAFDLIESGEKLITLSYDSKSGKAKWKNIIATGRKISDVIEVSVSQTGRAEKNTIKITPDHKMVIFDKREMVKKKISDVLDENKFVNIVDKIPFTQSQGNEKLSYLAGAIFTDGYVNLQRTKGYVTFTQKETDAKKEFISTVKSYFHDVFNKEFNISRIKHSHSHINGRLVQGEVLDMICTSMQPAIAFNQLSQNLVPWVLSLDENSTFNFLAGVIDGDGTICNGRIQIYASKENLQQAIICACLKLGLVPQATFNRGILNIQIVERVSDILKYTKRVKGNADEKMYGSKLFSIKQLFSDVVEDVNFMGRAKEAIKRNLLFDAEKIARDILPLCRPEYKEQVAKILNSDLRMYRAVKNAELGKSYVYNFEVDSENELDKNFVVFTKMYTPLLVSNSHAAVVARGMGKCCVAGCGDISINAKEIKVKGLIIKDGDFITLDGSTGEVFLGKIPVVDPVLSGDFETLINWADEVRRLKIRANADIPRDAEVAVRFGAQGIGLCRTEHMFFEGERIKPMREMIIADTLEGRKKALAKLLPFQKKDFIGLFKVMKGKPVTIRLLDPPLHEFLPQVEEDIAELACEMKISVEKIKQKISDLHEFNPMLGHRGCRLGINYPEITEMQAKAIFEAAIETNAVPEVMIPLVGDVKEFIHQKEIIVRVAKEIMKNKPYKVGTMIEVPRAAVTAGEIAKEAEFFSFGTNDLTQMGCGFSRDDAGKFLKQYVELGIYEKDPFQALDRNGVGELMRIAVKKGREVRPDIKLGICGEHGGEPSSIEFCNELGLDYVSCSPFRVPIARLAAAQAVLKSK